VFVCYTAHGLRHCTAFVVYEDIYDAKAAVDHLSGFNVCGRYLIVLYYQAKISQKNVDEKAKRLEIAEIKAKYNVKDEDEDEVVPPPRKRAAA
jgi:pre-mRNA branch site protein p14